MNHSAPYDTKVQKLPQIGTITIPIHMFHGKEQEDFQSGFAFFRIVDNMSDVYSGGNDDVHLGTIGATMGGHTQINMNDLESKEEKSDSVIIDVATVWNAVAELFDSKQGQEKIAEINDAYKIKKEAENGLRLKKEIEELEIEDARLEKEERDIDNE